MAAVGSRGRLRTGTPPPSAALQMSRSSPNFGLHHRGEHAFGTVRGFDHAPDDQYVPRAGWTESFSSPLKHRSLDPDSDKWLAMDKQERAHKATMKQYVKGEMFKQIKDREATLQTMKASDMELGIRAATVNLTQMMKEKEEGKLKHKDRQRAFRDGLGGQVEHKEQKARDRKREDVHEGAEIKMRTTQQLVRELAKADRVKEERRQEMLATMQEVQAVKAQQRLDKERENAELRRSLRETLHENASAFVEQQRHVKHAMAAQESFYKYFSATTGAEQQGRLDREARRQDKDEKHHNTRMDMHYAQREMARERQRQRMCETLRNQVDAKSKKGENRPMQNSFEREAMCESMRQGREAELQKQNLRRSEELANQAALVEQMRAKQQREREENPHRRPNPACSTMAVTPALLASAEAWRSGAAASGAGAAADLAQSLEAAKHLAKPLGKPEAARKPSPAIESTMGAGGVVGVFGGEGPTKAILMSTGGPAKLLTKTAALAERDRNFQRPWREGVTPEELKAARRVAAQRARATAADKAIS